MADFAPTPRDKNSLDNAKFSLTAKNSVGRQANFKVELINNNPRLTIYTGDPADQENNHGRIQAKLDAPAFMVIINTLEELARKGDGPKIYSMDNMLQKFKDKKPVDEWYVANTVKFGRDDDGQIWISVIERNRPKLKFVLTNPRYHVLKNPDGSDAPVGEVSKMYTLAWTGVMKAMIGPCMNTNYTPPKPRDNAGGFGGGQGGYNKGNKNFSRSNDQSQSNSNTADKAVSSYEGVIDDDLWS